MTPTQEKSRPSPLKVVGKTLAVLGLFDEKRPEWGASEVARATEVSVPTAHRILHTLSDAGYLTQRARGRFSLGPTALSLGRRAQRSMDLPTLLAAELHELSTATGETAVIAVPSDESGEPVYADHVESSAALRITPPLGTAVPFYASAFGKAFIAFLPDEVREMYLHRPLEELGPATITDPEQLKEDMELTRERGHACAIEETGAGVWEMAVPIRAADGEPIAAIGVTGPTHPDERMPDAGLAAMVGSIAARAEARIGAWQQGVRIRRARHQLRAPLPEATADPVTGPPAAPEPVEPVRPWGTFRIGHTVPIETLNPLRGINISTMKVFAAIYPQLVNEDGEATVSGDLAESWEVSADGRQITFALRPGGLWTSGRPITADDCAFTLNLLLESHADAYGSLLVGIVGARAVDEHTLVIEYDTPTATALSNLSLIPILPQHYWEPMTAEFGTSLRDAPIGPDVVTGGPFRVVSYAPEEAVLLELHEDSYTAMPHVERIAWIFYRSDERMVDDLRAGVIDTIDDLAGITAGFETLKHRRAVRTWQQSGTTLWNIGFNSNPDKKSHRELLDPRVREALAHAVDRERIVAEALRGMGHVSNAIIAPSLGLWSNEEILPESFDLVRAAELLDAAGFPVGPDGWRIAGDHAMRYAIHVTADVPAYHLVVDIIRAAWREIGVEVVPEFLATEAMNEAVTGPRGTYQTCDIFLWCWALMVFDPQSTLRVLSSDELGALNDSGFSDERYDRLYRRQAQETNQERRRALVDEMQTLVAERRPYIPICFLDGVGALRSEWEGLKPTSLGAFPASTKQPYLSVRRRPG